MKQVEVELSAVITINQTLSLTDEEASYIKEHEGCSSSMYSTQYKELYHLLDNNIDFDCISEIRAIDVEIVDILEEEEND